MHEGSLLSGFSNMSKRRILKDFSLVVAGALAGMIATLVLEPLPRLLVLLLGSIAFLFLSCYGFSLFDIAYNRIVLSARNHRKDKTRRIGILGDMPWCGDIGKITSWANVSTDQWIKRIRNSTSDRVALRACRRTMGNNLHRCSAIINPYGGVYPETDTVGLVNLSRIFEYVQEGGVFVNVADIPGYWMYDARLRTKIDATPSIYGVSSEAGIFNIVPVRPFEKTPFMEKLSIRILNVEGWNATQWKYTTIILDSYSQQEIMGCITERLAIIEKNIQPIVTVEIPNDNNTYTPFFYIHYGKGKFVFSLYFLDVKYPKNSVLVEKIIRILGEL